MRSLSDDCRISIDLHRFVVFRSFDLGGEVKQGMGRFIRTAGAVAGAEQTGRAAQPASSEAVRN